MIEINKSNKITNLSDADFLAFLYAERNRENSLNEYQGWNNWALVGAFVTVVCAGYAVLKNCCTFNWNDVFYYSVGIIPFFLIYHTWWRAFKRERGVDFYKVRMLKEIAPYVQIVFVLICAIAATIIIPIIDGFNVTFWWWVAVIAVYIIAIILVFIFRNKIIPAFYQELFLPWFWGNTVLVGIMGAVLATAGGKSFRMSESSLYSAEFTVAACITACFIIVFIFITINTNNKSVRRFDKIIDNYIYTNDTKEETYRRIAINRMGYGVMEACDKEFNEINRLMKTLVEDDKYIESIEVLLDNDQFTINHLHDFDNKVKTVCENQTIILELSQKLSGKLKEIINVVPIYKSIPELDYIINTSVANGKRIDALSAKTKRVIGKIEKHIIRDNNA